MRLVIGSHRSATQTFRPIRSKMELAMELAMDLAQELAQELAQDFAATELLRQ